MRITRNQTKRAAKDRHRRHQKLRSTDGPQCPHCEPHVNAKLSKYTFLSKLHRKEMDI